MTQLDKQQSAELEGKGVDIKLLNEYRKALDELNKLLQQIETDRNDVIKYEDAVETLFSKEADIRNNIKGDYTTTYYVATTLRRQTNTHRKEEAGV